SGSCSLLRRRPAAFHRRPAMSLLRGTLVLATCLAIATSHPARTEPAAPKAPPKTAEAKPPRTDRYGDPLPSGAVARLGTVRWRHTSQVAAGAYSPTARLLAPGGCAGTVRLWQAATGKPVFQFPVPGCRQTSWVTFSPDNKTVAAVSGAAGDDKTIRLWNV